MYYVSHDYGSEIESYLSQRFMFPASFKHDKNNNSAKK
jgi:hypothetical protein